MSRAHVLASLLSIVLASSVARAEDAIVKGAIVKVEHAEIYVNLGTAQSVEDGASLRIKRTIRLRHPVTRAMVVDWIPIGSAVVTQAGGQLSRAVVGDLVTAVKVGDVIEIFVDRPDAPAPAPSPTPTPPAPKPPAEPAIDPRTAEVLAAFVAQTNQSIDVRIATWERYLSTRPDSPFAEAIRADLMTLQQLREQMRPPSVSDDDTVAAELEHLPRASVQAGAALPLVFVIGRPEQVASAYLHYRPRDRKTYSRILLAREHDIYLRATLPPAAIAEPGVDYFVEVSTPSGRSGIALGSPQLPLRVDVAPPPLPERFGIGAGRTSVRLGGEVLQFSTFDKRDGDRRDSMYTATLDFGYRLDTTVQRIGIGYGATGGVGGSEDMTWDGTSIPRVGFHYGRADVDLGSQGVAAGISMIAGVGKQGLGVGLEGRFRVGDPEGTNVSSMVRVVPELGSISEVRLGAQPFDNVLTGVSVGATNQPLQDDVAAKLGVDFEFIHFEHVSFLVRTSWQGRSTRHGGIGGGAAVGFTW